ncbi:hypothetical protein LAJ19_20750 (plasmid) [Deinococcus taeanensis]|uniref:hypothetical protein n=1 Tax=Deinococcus taeanensis TaxID=2737050 RepID=UPI001CDCC1DB|nr:hypothetical protein [Deinococcus taeanensis]UBV45232.1 hypothetical protein LAJ19_20750 [Deinococcus taeanensis]
MQAVKLKHYNSTRAAFYSDVRLTAVMVFVGYAFLGLMIVGFLSSVHLEIERPWGLTFLIAIAVAGTLHYLYGKVLQAPYTAEERWIWLDFETRELLEFTRRTGRIPASWTTRKRFDRLTLSLDSPFCENSSDEPSYDVYLSRRDEEAENTSSDWYRPRLHKEQHLYSSDSLEDALEVTLFYQQVMGCPAWNITQFPGVPIEAQEKAKGRKAEPHAQ